MRVLLRRLLPMQPSQSRVYVRHVESRDRQEILALAKSSRALHSHWIAPPLTNQTFRLYLKRTHRDDHVGLACCLCDTDRIVGVININGIERGSIMSASLGYYVSEQFQGQGYMTEGLKLATEYAFREVGLHRLEANIQPSNLRSRSLVERCGFQLEGLSKEFQFIDGKWRDHERWALINPYQLPIRRSTL